MNFLISIFSIAVLGLFPALLIGRLYKYRYVFPELIGASFLLGMWLVGVFQFIYSLISFKMTLLSIGVICGIFFILDGFLLRMHFKDISFKGKENSFKDWVTFEKLILLGILIQVLWAFYLVLPLPVHSYDSVADYSLKAKIFYLNQGIPSGFFKWSESTVTHPDYPLLLPLLMSWVYYFTGFNDLLVTKIMPVVYIFFLIFLYALFNKLTHRKYSLLGIFILATVPQLMRYAMIIHADFLIAVFVTCAFIYFVLYLDKGKNVYLILSALFFAILVWIKNEGIVFFGAFLATFFLQQLYSIYKKKGFEREIAIPLLIIVLIPLSWLVFKRMNNLVNSDINFTAITLKRALINIKDSPVLLYEFQKEVFNPKKWNIFWVILAVIFIWKRKHFLKGTLKFAIIFIFLSICGYLLGYILTTSRCLSYYAEKTMSRFMLHFLGVFIVLLVILLRNEIGYSNGSIYDV